MLLRVFLLLFLHLSLFAQTDLLQEYEVSGKDIMLSSIIPSVKEDIKLYSITEGRHTRKVRTKELITLLKEHGFSGLKTRHKYIKFIEKSPIDTSFIEEKIRGLYLQKYQSIDIKSIKVKPRAYLDTLPQKYSVKVQAKNFLKREGVVSIKSEKNRQLFFNYIIDAKIEVYSARKDIKRNSELSNINCVKKSIILDKFRAMPVQNVQIGRLQSKRHIKADTILTQRDIKELHLVRRGSNVNITLNNSNIAISFSAKALEDGVYGDIIRVKQKNSTVLKVKVTGKNKGEAI